MHDITVRRDGYEAWWVCSCGWATLMRDKNGHIPGSAQLAIHHASDAPTPSQCPPAGRA